MKKYGYARVSSRDQNPDRQLDALRKLQIAEENIYVDKMSGKNFDRPSYKRLLRKMKSKDVLVVMSIDRLGRNYDEILEQWRILTKVKNVNIEVVDMPLLNTTCERDGLTGTFVADLVLQILAYVAETERNFIRQRQAEGIASAKARGVKFGAERMEMPDAFEQCYVNWMENRISVRNAAKALGISATTFYRRCQERKQLEME